MGYDLYLLDLPEHLQPQMQKHRRLWDRYVALRDRPSEDPEQRAAWEALEVCPDPGYFRLSITGMGRMRAVMDLAGMLAREGTPLHRPDWRHLPDKTLDGKLFRPDGYQPGAILTPDQIAYVDELGRWCRYRPGGNVGIQAWKLRSNDYWIVTAEECAESLRTWESLPPERQQGHLGTVATTDIVESDESLRSWRQTLEHAFETGGFDGQQPEPGSVTVTLDRPADLSRLIALWEAWLGFLRLAAEGDGFTVE